MVIFEMRLGLMDDVEYVLDEIVRIKERKGYIILAHYYQILEIQRIADFVGDSLGLSLRARDTKANGIIFCGVYFMAEQAAILNPDVPVYIPNKDARCPMAMMLTVDDIIEAKKKYPKAPVVLYVNSRAEHKALADYIVTSSNAVKVIEAIPSEQIIFGPDRNLAEYVAEKTGKEIIPIPPYGCCYVHIKFSEDDVRRYREKGYTIIVHPECNLAVRHMADFIGSTSQLYNYIKSCQSSNIAVGTEVGMVYRAQEDFPEKNIQPLNESAICKNMKKITIESLYRSIRDDVYRVRVEESIAKKVREALERTFQLM